MAKDGVPVKPLESYPELLEVDVFYKEAYIMAGNNLPNIKTYCDLYGLSAEETLETILILNLISSMVD